jgi:hypothetical protein
MRIRHFGAPCALAAALILVAPVTPSALAAPAQKESWIGAWGFVPTPLPPGITPPPPVPLATLADSPLGNPPPSPVPASPPPGALLLDNPGNVPVAMADSDPSNVTVRQLVRVSVAGKQIRLRFSNEGGSDVLKLGSVHVGIAGPDGSIVAGSDHAVTFDGNANVIIPASAPLLSDPVDMKVDALQKLLISIHVPGVLSRTGHSLFQYVSPGDVSASAQMPAQRIMRLPALVTQLEVDPVRANAVVVTFGDSIT